MSASASVPVPASVSVPVPVPVPVWSWIRSIPLPLAKTHADPSRGKEGFSKPQGMERMGLPPLSNPAHNQPRS
ncbi:MAG: hypothetical protein L6Q76_08945 [Polyangiaceae bacterium]|nr:hypothetical protein [Polyangiaceae bacterium]